MNDWRTAFAIVAALLCAAMAVWIADSIDKKNAEASAHETIPVWSVTMSDGATNLVQADFLFVIECGFLKSQIDGRGSGGFAAGTWEAFELIEAGPEDDGR